MSTSISSAHAFSRGPRGETAVPHPEVGKERYSVRSDVEVPPGPPRAPTQVPPVDGHPDPPRIRRAQRQAESGEREVLGAGSSSNWGRCGTAERLRSPGGLRGGSDARAGRTRDGPGSFCYFFDHTSIPFGLLFILQNPFLSIHGGPLTAVWDGGPGIEGGNRRYRGGKAAGPRWDGCGTGRGNAGDQWGRGGYRSGKVGELLRWCPAKWEGKGKR